MYFNKVQRVVTEYTTSKTRRSFLVITVIVLCFLSFSIWKTDKNVKRTIYEPLSLLTVIPVTNVHESIASPVKNEDELIVTPVTNQHQLIVAPVTNHHPLILIPVTNQHPLIVTPSPLPVTIGVSHTTVNRQPNLVVMPTTTTTANPNTTFLPPVKVYPRPFPYLIIEEDLCAARYSSLFMLTYVHTAPGNFEQREIIRDTWGNKNLYFRLRTVTIFILGKTQDESIASKIKQESEQHHDIIQEDFLDAYKNLTYKGIAALRWITLHCLTPKYVLKVDDDMLVNTFEIVRFLRKTYKQKPNSEQILCLFYNRNMPVMRDVKSKWYVSERDYPDKMYLPYCSGSAYIFPMSIVPQLYNASFITPFFWVDDVYVTGMLARNANVTHQSIEKFYILYKGASELSENIVFGNKIFGHFNKKPTKEWRYEFWRNITEIEQWMG